MTNKFYTESVALDYLDEIRQRLSNSIHVSNFCLDELKSLDTDKSQSGNQNLEYIKQIRLATMHMHGVLEELRQLTADIYSLDTKSSMVDYCFAMKNLALFTYQQLKHVQFIFSPEIETMPVPVIDDYLYFDFLYQCKSLIAQNARVVRIEKGEHGVILAVVERSSNWREGDLEKA